MEAPENTLLAFKRAIELGSDYIECDIRLTKDKVPIVFHDDKMSEAFICELSLKEVKSQNASVPTFEELLSLRFEKTGLMIEIKKTEQLSDVKIIYDVLKSCNSLPHFFIGSIEVNIVAYLKKLDSDLPLIGIVESENQLEAFLQLQPQVLAFHYPLLNPLLMTTLHAQKIEIWGWTIDDPSFEIEGLDGIITNNVAHFLQTKPHE